MKDYRRLTSMLRTFLLFFLILTSTLLLFRASAFADETGVKATGYARNFFILTNLGDDMAFDALSRLRLRLNVKPSESSYFEVAYELVPGFRDGDISSAYVPGPALFSYRAVDLDENIYPPDKNSGSDFVLAQNLDRLLLTLSTSALDISIGRQSIAFGSARVINPTDIIAPFVYNTIAKEELVGADALRVKTPLSEMGELDMGIVFGDDFEPDKSAGFIRLKTYQVQTDIAFMVMVFRKNILVGIDLARSIGGAGAWFEAAQVFAQGASGENYLRLSVGADYSFTDGLYTYIEYHYSGAGTGSPENYFNAIAETAFTDGSVYLLGRHYIAPGLTYEITPLLVFSAQALVNVEDWSALGSTGFEYNAAEDVYVNLGAYVGLGQESDDPTRPENEFGLYPDVYYTALNFYF